MLKSHDGVGSFLAKPAAEDLGATMDLSTTAIHRIAAIPAETPVSTTPDLPMEEPGEKVLYFGDYELQVEIARGAMGVVYRAEQKSLKQTVAIKMIRSTMLSTDADVARFHAEAEAHTVAGMETPTKWGQEMAAAMNLSIRAIARARG